MSINQPSQTRKSIIERAVVNGWQQLIAPHPSLTNITNKRRVRLSLALELIVSIFLLIAILSRPSSYSLFIPLLAISLSAYLFGKSTNFRFGIYLFTYGFTFMGFSRIFQGASNSIETVIYSTVLVSILISSILLSRRGFISLIILTTIATLTLPNLAKSPSDETVNVTQLAGILATVGIILISADIYRGNLDKDKYAQVEIANTALEKAKADLEKNIFDNDKELKQASQKIQQRIARLKIISEISQEIVDNSKLELLDLLTKSAQSISEKLGFYHIGVFLMDRNHEYAVLRASNSKGGQQLLARRHQLRAGGTGVVGYVSQSGRIRIALDTGSDAVYFNNPDLPDTRSEIAIPLKYGTNIIGVLDVQSKLPSAFNDEDVDLLTIIANLIAAEVRSRTNLENSSEATTSQSPNLSQRQGISAYTYNLDGTISSSPKYTTAVIEKSLSIGEPYIIQPSNLAGELPTMAIPVKYRDQIIGIINVESSEKNHFWSEDEITLIQAIADRAALALENARLFENATRRAEQEQTIAQVTNQIGSSTDFNMILQNTIQELGRALGTSRSFIQLNVPPEDQKTQNTTGQDR